MAKGKLNLDIENKIAEFEAIMTQVFPKKVFYKRILRGKGLEFDGYRIFEPDEDSSLIDWKASTRANNLLTRQYIEEKKLKVMVAIDVGENMVFGSGEKLKCEYCAEMIVAFANIVLKRGDRIGFLLFSDKVVKVYPPGTLNKPLDILIYELSNPDNYGGVSNISDTLGRIMDFLNPSISLVVIVSDFIRMKGGIRENLEKLGSIYETIALVVKDPFDVTFPEINKEVTIEDIESGEKLIINPEIAKGVYEANSKRQIEFMKKIFSETKIDFLELSTQESFAFNLANFLKSRTEKRGF